jgi:FolB domain-containing protein
MIFKEKSSRIVLHKLELLVFLGCGPAERKRQQSITVDIHITFKKPPAACKTDHLNDTFCYDTLQQTIKNHIAKKEFHLIEHVAHEIYVCVKQFLYFKNTTTICVTKYPDAFFKSGGVSFWYGD